MIYNTIDKLVSYGVGCGLIEQSDMVYTRNRLLELLGLDEYAGPDEPLCGNIDLEQTLAELIDYAAEHGIVSGRSADFTDLFDTKAMGLMVPRPSDVIVRFMEKYRRSPIEATDYFYKLSCDSDYIRRYRIKKDKRWVTPTEYGDIDITINLSKPEKDPKAIASALSAPQSGYPACALCRETEGYAGNARAAARQNHRLIPIALTGENYFFQYSPYVYYNEHCIILNEKHIPMAINRATMDRLLDFVDQFPHYFIGSNADLPIVGGSILSHDHFQGGNYEFAMARAAVEKEISFSGFEDISAGIVKWPMSVIRLNGTDKSSLAALADKILCAWRGYSDPDAFIFSHTGDTPHNTITPIARRRGEKFELDLVLRNNITTKEHPLGVYHPHAELHHIKKENIGLIEVMGLAVLPSRLKAEMDALAGRIADGLDLYADAQTEKHAQWAQSFTARCGGLSKEKIAGIIEQEIGKVFLTVLEHAGVYKHTAEGMAAFERFTAFVG